MTKYELETLTAQFGKAVQVVVMRSKKQALVEFEKLDQAMKMKEHFPLGYFQAKFDAQILVCVPVK